MPHALNTDLEELRGNLEASSMGTCSCGIRGCHVSCQETGTNDSLSSCRACGPQQWVFQRHPQWRLWGAFIVGVAVNYLSEFKALSIGRDSCLVCKPNKLLMAGAVIDTRGKPMTAIFLNQYNFWLYSKYVSFDPQINVVLKKKRTFSFATDRDYLLQDAEKKGMRGTHPQLMRL